MIKKKIKDLTGSEMYNFCLNRSHDGKECEGCPLWNDRSEVCAKWYPDTLDSKFTEEEMSVEVELNE